MRAAWEVQINARREFQPWSLRDFGYLVARHSREWSTQPYTFRRDVRKLVSNARGLISRANNVYHGPSETARTYVRQTLLLDKA
jgi:hypothetical protein